MGPGISRVTAWTLSWPRMPTHHLLILFPLHLVSDLAAAHEKPRRLFLTPVLDVGVLTAS